MTRLVSGKSTASELGEVGILLGGSPRRVVDRSVAEEHRLRRVVEVADLVERGVLTTPIARTYSLEQAPAALDAMRSHDRALREVVLLS